MDYMLLHERLVNKSRLGCTDGFSMGFVPLVTKNQALGGQIGNLFQEMLKRLRQEILILFLG